MWKSERVNRQGQLFSFGVALENRTEAQPQGALHYSAEASLTHQPLV